MELSACCFRDMTRGEGVTLDGRMRACMSEVEFWVIIDTFIGDGSFRRVLPTNSKQKLAKLNYLYEGSEPA